MNKLIFIFLLSSIIFFNSCDNCYEPGEFVQLNNGIYNTSFYIYDEITNTSLYSPQTYSVSCNIAGGYYPDTLKLFDVNFDPILINYSAGSSTAYKFYNLPIYIESIDYLAKSQIISKKFYVILNSLDIDSIEISYSLEYNKKCEYYYFSNQQVTYNGKVIDNLPENMNPLYFKK